MFTGIISALGEIEQYPETCKPGSVLVKVEQDFIKDTKIGDSIAVNGVCLTVTSMTNNSFTVDISAETVARTNFDELYSGQRVNLEHSLHFGDSLDGHLVQGHVDTVILLADKESCVSGNTILTFMVPEQQYCKYIAEKGSVAINGISLTVNNVNKNMFQINIIPYTLQVTNLAKAQKGDRINLEIDMFARYCVNYLEHTAKVQMHEGQGLCG